MDASGVADAKDIGDKRGGGSIVVAGDGDMPSWCTDWYSGLERPLSLIEVVKVLTLPSEDATMSIASPVSELFMEEVAFSSNTPLNISMGVSKASISSSHEPAVHRSEE
jgi:hypothetical protein